MMKNQKKLVLIFSLLFVVLVVVYFTVIVPLVQVDEEEAASLETVEGEDVGPNNRYLMFPHAEKSDIQSIEVHNQYGVYRFYRDSSDDFQLEGYEGMAYDQELFSSLVVTTGYTLAMTKIMDNATAEDFAEYGLDEPQAYWILTTTEGAVHQVNVGDNLVTDGGYYVQYEGRNSIYVLSTTLASTILQPVEKLMTPLLTVGMSTNDYFQATNFTIWHGEDLFLRIANVPDEEKSDPEAIVECEMLYPSPYQPNDSLYFEVLYNMIALQGTETVRIGPTEEELAEYGLDEPAYTVYFQFQDYEFYIFFSEKQEDGSYYAVSNLYSYQLVAKMDGSTLTWLESSLFHWISEYPFQETITNVKTLSVDSPEVKVSFDLTHGVTESGTNTLDVTGKVEASRESEIPAVVSIPDADVYNFRQFYRTLLGVVLEEYTPLDESEKEALTADPDKWLLTFRYEKLDGETVEFSFYQYSTRRAFVTVNGEGEFYTLVDYLDKILNDTERVLVALDVNSYGKD